jgi:AcrR family transcriptional regulator
MKTRERILHASLELFNEYGEPNVTTLLIADELDISPGNLYYHFKSKTDILTEIFGWYETEMLSLLEVPDKPIDLEDQWLMLHLIFENISKYRFLYRDLINVLGRHEKIAHRFKKILNKQRAASHKICTSLSKEGVLKANSNELNAVAESIVMTATYWINYSMISSDGMDEDTLLKGVYQVMSLIAPYLDVEQRELLDNLRQAYLN